MQKQTTQLRPLPPEQWPDSLAGVLSDTTGQPLNVHQLMANNPTLLKAWWDFRNHAVSGASLGKRLGEIIILRVAVHMGAWYEWGSHVERGLTCGLSLEEIERINGTLDEQHWTEREFLLLQAVDQLVMEQRLSEDMCRKLSWFFSAEQLLDLMAIQGMYVILGCMINTWGLTLDPHIEARLPPQVSEASFMNRYSQEDIAEV